MILQNIILFFIGILIAECEGDDTPTQCSDYMLLDDATRHHQHPIQNYGDNLLYSFPSPDWKGVGWYRLTGGAGNFIPESSPGYGHCGTSLPGYLITSHPTEVGVTVDGTVCFDATAWIDDACYYPREIQITRCQDFYVYYLRRVDEFSMRYCGTFNL